MKYVGNFNVGLICCFISVFTFDGGSIGCVNLLLGILNMLLFLRGNFCWHQWKDFNLTDYPVREQWCIHCGEWRNKEERL